MRSYFEILCSYGNHPLTANNLGSFCAVLLVALSIDSEDDSFPPPLTSANFASSPLAIASTLINSNVIIPAQSPVKNYNLEIQRELYKALVPLFPNDVVGSRHLIGILLPFLEDIIKRVCRSYLSLLLHLFYFSTCRITQIVRYVIALIVFLALCSPSAIHLDPQLSFLSLYQTLPINSSTTFSQLISTHPMLFLQP